MHAVDEGFNLVMFSDEEMQLPALFATHVKTVCTEAALPGGGPSRRKWPRSRAWASK